MAVEYFSPRKESWKELRTQRQAGEAECGVLAAEQLSSVCAPGARDADLKKQAAEGYFSGKVSRPNLWPQSSITKSDLKD